MSVEALWVTLTALWAGCLASGPWTAVGFLPAVAALFMGRSRPATRRLAVTVTIVFAGGVLLVAGRAALVERGPLARLAAEGGTAAVSAVVVAEPEASDSGSWMIVRVTAVDQASTRARALLRLPGGPIPAFGDRLQLRAAAEPLGVHGFDAYLERVGVAAQLRTRSAVQRVAGPGPLIAATNDMRARMRQAADRHLPTDDAALLVGLVTGDTTGQTQERAERFEAVGLTHLVAVSGSNVALVLAGVLGIGAVLGLGVRTRRLVAIGAVVWFVVLVRAEPSVLRASVMAVLVLVAALRGRGTDLRHTLGVAALLLLLADPLLARQLGFALSVGATAGVLLLGPVITERLPGPLALRRLVGASAGAQIGVAPILLALPGGLPLASVPANLVAVPAAAVAAGVGVAVALLAQASVGLAGVLALLAWPSLWVIDAVARLLAAGPRLTTAGATVPVIAVLACALLVGRRAPRFATAAVVVTVAAATLPGLRPPTSADALTVTVLDVGQGDAVLVEAPAADGSDVRLLVDGGPEPGALPLLRARRIRSLDAVALTHAHADHSDGLPAVIAALDVGALLVGPRPLPPDATESAVATYAAARGRSVPIVPVAAGTTFPLGAASVEVLSPPAGARVGEGPNDESLVLRVATPAGVALLPGDAEAAAQQALLRDPGRLRADLIKVPHHGGDTNAPGFLQAAAADVAIVSVGADNSYGHPTPDVLTALGGTPVWRTDQHGDVRAVLSGAVPQVTAERRARAPPDQADVSPPPGQRIGRRRRSHADACPARSGRCRRGR